MTKLIGLTGPAGSGKDTVADFLVAKHGFTKLAFADKLRAEICDAYDVPVQLLLERQTKDTPLPKLALVYCRDEAFIDWFLHTGYIYGKHGGGLAPALFTPHARSPRETMQAWGDYRRATNPHYFIDAMQDRLDVLPGRAVVISDVRVNPGELANVANAEAHFVHALGGEIWQLTRPGHGHGGHATEHAFARNLIDRNVMNYGTIETLHRQADLFVTAEVV